MRPGILRPRPQSLRIVNDATVVLTRQAGSNGKAKTALLQYGVRPLVLPLIKFRARPEAAHLTKILGKRGVDWVALTSPHAAHVFLESWREAACPTVRVATFEGTRKELEGAGEGLQVGYVPTVSNAEHFASELPKKELCCEEVLYPASTKADDTLEKALRDRHFTVTRLDTYETGTVEKEEIDSEALERALEADVTTFASPTAVRAWIEITGEDCNFRKPVACIGSTTAKKARELGFENVYFSENPGIDGLVHSVLGVLRQKGKLKNIHQPIL